MPIATAKRLLGHSKVDLTPNVYTKPQLVSLTSAVELLPALSGTKPPATENEAAQLRATGTDDMRPHMPESAAAKGGVLIDQNLAALKAAQNPGIEGVKLAANGTDEDEDAEPQKVKKPSGKRVFSEGFEQEAPAGFEPAMADLQSA